MEVSILAQPQTGRAGIQSRLMPHSRPGTPEAGLRLSQTFMIAASRLSARRLKCASFAQATLIVVVAGLLWRTVRYALAFPLWGDEAFVAVNFLTRDLLGLTRPLEYFQIAPPGFLLAEWLAVRAFGTGERALRLVPYLAGVASLLLFWRFCREVTSRRTVLAGSGHAGRLVLSGSSLD